MTLSVVDPHIHFWTMAMFASNFPVDRLFSDYAPLWHAYEETVGGCSADERDGLRTNAERFCRI